MSLQHPASLTPVTPYTRVEGPLERPSYNNRFLGSYPAWIEDNHRALAAWWWECDRSLRAQGKPPANPADFDLFCQCQHERELRTVQS